MKKEGSIIIINACNKIIDIFLGPFLIAYFIKTSNDNLIELSVYKIFCFFFLGFNSILAGYMVEKNHGLKTFRMGVIARFIYILLIILLKEKIIEFLPIMAFLWGLSTILFWFPFNIYNVYSIKNENRIKFEAKKKTVSYIISIVVPTFLGATISSTNYRMNAVIILIFSLLEIIMTFYLKPLPNYKYNYNLKNSFKNLKKDKSVSNFLSFEFLFGFCVSDSALSIIITIFIINTFKSDINIGLINSIASALTLLTIILYSKIKSLNGKNFINISIIIITISSIVLFIFNNSLSVILYYCIFETLGCGLISLIESVKLNKISNSKIDIDDINEFMVIREIILNLGRIFSVIFLLLVCLIDLAYLNYLFLLFNIITILLGVILNKVKE